MSNDEVRRIAEDYVKANKFSPCTLESVRRVPSGELSERFGIGDKWIVQFAFPLDEDVACTSEVAIVIVDDETGTATSLESL